MTEILRRPDINEGRVSGTQSITRACAVLNAFREASGDLGVVEVGEQLGLTLSTAHRIARALVVEGYLAQEVDRERYRLGPQALLLGQAAQRALGMDLVRPVLQRLAGYTGESVNLGLLDGDHAVVIQRVDSIQPLRISMEVGARIELHATSMGKSMLAFNDSLSAYVDSLEAGLPRLTPKTHPTVASLRSDLARIAQQGWSTDDEESIIGVRCVAAPVLDGAGQARAAVAIQAPVVRMPDERFAELGPRVRVAAHALTGLLPI